MNDDTTCITVCQGPPRCELVGDDAVQAQRQGCVWCDRTYIDPAGNETREQHHEH